MLTKTPKQQRNKPTFWTVRFQNKKKINLVVIYNRKDGCCASRIDGAQVFAGSKKCGTIRYIPGHTVYYVSCDGAVANYVKIVQPRNILNLAEVQVFGESNSKQ
jgi:hypothetical protein